MFSRDITERVLLLFYQACFIRGTAFSLRHTYASCNMMAGRKYTTSCVSLDTSLTLSEKCFSAKTSHSSQMPPWCAYSLGLTRKQDVNPIERDIYLFPTFTAISTASASGACLHPVHEEAVSQRCY